MTIKHTPGPWHYDWTTKINGVIQGWAVGPADKPLDEMDHIDPVFTVGPDISEADLCLITTAPELRAMLEAMTDFTAAVIDRAGLDDTNGVIQASRDLIARADGEG